MLRRNVARLRKEHGKATKLPITQENGIAVSARLGVFDLCRDYGVPEPLVKTMGRATQLAVAAGLECMKDAGLIPSVDGQLPEGLRDGTGIIYATSFPALDAAIGEISKYGDPRRRPTSELLDALAARVDPKIKTYKPRSTCCEPRPRSARSPMPSIGSSCSKCSV